MSERAREVWALALNVAMIFALALLCWPQPWAALAIGWNLSVAVDLLVSLGEAK